MNQGSASYNRISSQSLERLAALSDGVFAVAMTLLVLDLKGPAVELVHSDADLRRALCTLFPKLLTYLMSFLTLGIFWAGQQTQLNELKRSDRHLAWINLAYLFGMTLLPFSTGLLADFISYRSALLIYWLNILYPGVVLYANWAYARRAGLVREETPLDFDRLARRRIVVAQALYGLGAALCVFSNYWSIGFIVLVQLNFAIAPPLGRLSRI